VIAQRRLLRGGSWNCFPGFCRSAFRDFYLPVSRLVDVGFRVCCLPQD
jgi:formylglycine-generating enzyme required for sulfatase activity